ncbi:MAG: RecQ family ATP-dependent DNA helicase [Planctomycetes bacterium]|nr:RecQ family ATP-dependent DNA helicase [Planctomycetota bacterium]
MRDGRGQREFQRVQLEASELRAALLEHFGFADFRGPQEPVVQAVLAGRDALLTMPTGGGKSLCYQLPALILPGMTLVVSPLIALMKDQVDALRRRGVRAGALHSNLSGAEREEQLQLALSGDLDLLFVTPERFRSERFREVEARLPIQRLAVDEAHCISHWGHDFRPDYHRLGEVRERLGNPPVLALTATATPAVADDIVESLRLVDPLVIRTGIERENLFFACTTVESEEEKIERIADRVAGSDGAGVVYSALIKDLEHLHGELRRRGLESLVYHGKLSAEERRSMQDRFMRSERDVVLATNAFGMGVDKADIRFVIHAQIPRTLESWAQEVGRAGRDGAPAWCELFYFPEDIAIQQNFIEWANPTLEYLLGVYETLRGWGERIQSKDLDDLRDELLIKNRGDNRVQLCLKWLEVLGVTSGAFETHDLRLVRELSPGELPDFVGSEEKRKQDLGALLTMVRFATKAEECRRVQLARHFGLPEPSGACGTCDACVDGAAWHAAHFAPRRSGAAVAAEDPSAGFRRGDWVRLGRGELAQVVRVEGSGKRVRIVVEDAHRLERRTVDPRKSRVEKL